MNNYLYYIFIFLIFVSSCDNEITDIEESNLNAIYDQELYTQARGLLCLSRAIMGDGYIEYANYVTNSYQIKFSQKKEVVNLNCESSVAKPLLFIEEKNGNLYWTINGKDGIGDSNQQLEVTDSITMPVFKNTDGNFMYSVNNGKTWKNIEPYYRQDTLQFMIFIYIQ